MKRTVSKRTNINKTAKQHEYKCCDATFDGIHGWYKAMYEKLGWMN